MYVLRILMALKIVISPSQCTLYEPIVQPHKVAVPSVDWALAPWLKNLAPYCGICGLCVEVAKGVIRGKLGECNCGPLPSWKMRRSTAAAAADLYTPAATQNLYLSYCMMFHAWGRLLHHSRASGLFVNTNFACQWPVTLSVGTTQNRVYKFEALFNWLGHIGSQVGHKRNL